MRANISNYEMNTPLHLKEALQLLGESPGTWTPFAGGTDLMVLLEAGQLNPKNYLNLWGLSELRGIHVDAHAVTLGSLTTYSQVRADPVLQKEFPNLCRAAYETGAISIQNRGTLGGNIANASPAADSPPALLTYDAEIELVSRDNSRWIAYSDFHLGYKKTVLRPDEIISRVRLPRKTQDRIHYYRKVGTRKAQAISKVCFSGVIQLEKNRIELARIAMGSVAPIPYRCTQTESILTYQLLTPALIRKAQSQLSQELKPIGDIRSTAEYRLRVAVNLLEEFLWGCGIGLAKGKNLEARDTHLSSPL